MGQVFASLLERRDTAVMRMGYDSIAVILLFPGGLGLLATLD